MDRKNQSLLVFSGLACSKASAPAHHFQDHITHVALRVTKFQDIFFKKQFIWGYRQIQVFFITKSRYGHVAESQRPLGRLAPHIWFTDIFQVGISHQSASDSRNRSPVSPNDDRRTARGVWRTPRRVDGMQAVSAGSVPGTEGAGDHSIPASSN